MINQNLLLAGDDSYNLSKSLRFRSSASAYLSRTPTTATDRQKFTWSGWVKRGLLSTNQHFMSAGSSGTQEDAIYFNASSNILGIYAFQSGSYAVQLETTQVFRDPSAWYHIVVAVDTTQATSSNRIKMYVNGSQITSFAVSTYPSLNFSFDFNNTQPQNIGRNYNNNSYFDGYLTEVNFIDGQVLTPSSFGSTNSQTGVWQPKKYAGTYGTNGFYLPFTDVATTSGSNAGLGKDFSGNGNYWNTNNISVTAGATYDSMTDVPTLTSATAANYAVINPLNITSYLTLSDANLKTYGNTATDNGNSRSSIVIPTTGKWYAEFTVTGSNGAYPLYGITLPTQITANGATGQVGYLAGTTAYRADGQKYIANAASAYGASFTTNDVISIAVDCDNGAIYFAKNNTWQNSGVPTSGSSKTGAANTWTGGGTEFMFGVSEYNGTGTNTNFGQRPFAYTPPTGFKALNTYNLPTPTIGATASTLASKNFDATLYTGNGSTQTITNAGSFQPDFVWLKTRSTVQNHSLIDSVRGNTKILYSDLTNAEGTFSGVLDSFNSNGFTLGSSASVNQNGTTFVGWQWKANGSAVSNTAGSITSQVSANASAGFSVVTYTGTGANATVGHGLGVAPKMIITKSRSASQDWGVYHSSIGATGAIKLNTTGALFTDATMWNNTSPTSSVFSLGSTAISNTNSVTHVAYCFSEVAGYSKFGSYTGNGSTDGPFVHLGFRPKFVIIRRLIGASWMMYDSARVQYNTMDMTLFAQLSNAESSGDALDFISSGVKIRSTGASINSSGDTFIYMAFAENPFKYSLGR